MPHYGDGRATEESIRDATLNALQKADELDCESVVLPVLGTGAAGFPFDEGARIVCEAAVSYDSQSISDLQLIAYSGPEYDELERIAEDVKSS